MSEESRLKSFLINIQEFLGRFTDGNKSCDHADVNTLQSKFSVLNWMLRLEEVTDAETVELLVSCCLKYIDLLLKCSESLQTVYTRYKGLVYSYFSILSRIGKIPCVQNKFVEIITVPLLERITDPSLKSLCGTELARTLNNILPDSDKNIIKEILSGSAGIYLYKLADLVGTCGDYEYQTCLIETIFRMRSIDFIRQHASDFFPEAKILQDALAKIDIYYFDKSLRTFLNGANLIYKKVFSTVVSSAYLDSASILPPLDDLWVDFNIVSQTIGIFCDKGSFTASSSQEDAWELLTSFCTDISHVELKKIKTVNYKRPGSVSILFHKTAPCHCLFKSSAEAASANILHLVVDDNDVIDDLRTALFSMFGEKFQSSTGNSQQSISSLRSEPCSPGVTVQLTTQMSIRNCLSTDARSEKSLANRICVTAEDKENFQHFATERILGFEIKSENYYTCLARDDNAKTLNLKSACNNSYRLNLKNGSPVTNIWRDTCQLILQPGSKILDEIPDAPCNNIKPIHIDLTNDEDEIVITSNDVNNILKSELFVTSDRATDDTYTECPANSDGVLKTNGNSEFSDEPGLVSEININNIVGEIFAEPREAVEINTNNTNTDGDPQMNIIDFVEPDAAVLSEININDIDIESFAEPDEVSKTNLSNITPPYSDDLFKTDTASTVATDSVRGSKRNINEANTDAVSNSSNHKSKQLKKKKETIKVKFPFMKPKAKNDVIEIRDDEKETVLSDKEVEKWSQATSDSETIIKSSQENVLNIFKVHPKMRRQRNVISEVKTCVTEAKVSVSNEREKSRPNSQNQNVIDDREKISELVLVQTQIGMQNSQLNDDLKGTVDEVPLTILEEQGEEILETTRSKSDLKEDEQIVKEKKWRKKVILTLQNSQSNDNSKEKVPLTILEEQDEEIIETSQSKSDLKEDEQIVKEKELPKKAKAPVISLPVVLLKKINIESYKKAKAAAISSPIVLLKKINIESDNDENSIFNVTTQSFDNDQYMNDSHSELNDEIEESRNDAVKELAAAQSSICAVERQQQHDNSQSKLSAALEASQNDTICAEESGQQPCKVGKKTSSQSDEQIFVRPTMRKLYNPKDYSYVIPTCDEVEAVKSSDSDVGKTFVTTALVHEAPTSRSTGNKEAKPRKTTPRKNNPRTCFDFDEIQVDDKNTFEEIDQFQIKNKKPFSKPAVPVERKHNKEDEPNLSTPCKQKSSDTTINLQPTPEPSRANTTRNVTKNLDKSKIKNKRNLKTVPAKAKRRKIDFNANKSKLDKSKSKKSAPIKNVETVEEDAYQLGDERKDLFCSYISCFSETVVRQTLNVSKRTHRKRNARKSEPAYKFDTIARNFDKDECESMDMDTENPMKRKKINIKHVSRVLPPIPEFVPEPVIVAPTDIARSQSPKVVPKTNEVRILQNILLCPRLDVVPNHQVTAADENSYNASRKEPSCDVSCSDDSDHDTAELISSDHINSWVATGATSDGQIIPKEFLDTALKGYHAFLNYILEANKGPISPDMILQYQTVSQLGDVLDEYYGNLM